MRITPIGGSSLAENFRKEMNSQRFTNNPSNPFNFPTRLTGNDELQYPSSLDASIRNLGNKGPMTSSDDEFGPGPNPAMTALYN